MPVEPRAGPQLAARRTDHPAALHQHLLVAGRIEIDRGRGLETVAERKQPLRPVLACRLADQQHGRRPDERCRAPPAIRDRRGRSRPEAVSVRRHDGKRCGDSHGLYPGPTFASHAPDWGSLSPRGHANQGFRRGLLAGEVITDRRCYRTICPGSFSLQAVFSQFSIRRFGTRTNSRSLSVTSTQSRARACAAMSRSFGPISSPARSRRARSMP